MSPKNRRGVTAQDAGIITFLLTSTQSFRGAVGKEIDWIIEAYKEGRSLRAIAREIGRSHLFVWKIIKTSNPSILRPSRLWHKYSFNQNFFRDYTAENSYWMGFIDADGHVNTKRGKVELKIHRRDVDRLSCLRTCVVGDFPILQYRTRPLVGIMMTSRDMVGDLIGKNIGVNSPRLKPPSNIPEEYVRHFVRGYFDGDGSVSVGIRNGGALNVTFRVMGSKQLLEWIKEKLIDQAEISYKFNLRPGEGCWILESGSYRTLGKVGDYFYHDVNEQQFMRRKKEKFDRIRAYASNV